MPNWTSNRLTLVSKNKRVLEGFLKAAENCDIFSLVAPVPLALASKSSPRSKDDPALVAADVEFYGYPSWYDFSNSIWGTKWDAGEGGTLEEIDTDGTFRLNLFFNTAWDAPFNAYMIMAEKFRDVRFDASFMSYENGDIGTWTLENGMDSYSLDDFESIPWELVDEWNVEVTEYLNDDEDENEEENEEEEKDVEESSSGVEEASGDGNEGGRSV